MKNIKDEQYFKDLVYEIKSCACLIQERDLETEKRIDKRMYAEDGSYVNGHKYPELAVINSDFWGDLIKFCFDMGEIVDDQQFSFQDLKKYPDIVLEELEKIKYIVNEKEFNFSDYKK